MCEGSSWCRSCCPASPGPGGERAGTIWKVLPNKAVEAKAANEFSGEPDILRRGETELGVEECRRKGEPQCFGREGPAGTPRCGGHCSPSPYPTPSPGALTSRPLKGKRGPRCPGSSLFLITSHFNLDLHVDLSELGQGLYKALVSNSPNNKQEKA